MSSCWQIMPSAARHTEQYSCESVQPSAWWWWCDAWQASGYECVEFFAVGLCVGTKLHLVHQHAPRVDRASAHQLWSFANAKEGQRREFKVR
eukprot:m.57928 g.57928  ORF g.57928 m.57928 type:complete len:92 (-) comp17154_c0_seq1:301-576(-)